MKIYEQLKQQLQGSFDITFTPLDYLELEVYLIFCNSLTSMDAISKLLQGFVMNERQLPLLVGSYQFVDTLSQAVDLILSGQSILIIDEKMIALETRNYPTRSLHAPENEKSIRGSSDAFNENIITNVGLIRRRIRDDDLKVEMVKGGERSKTDIALCYLKKRVDVDVVDDLKHRIQNIGAEMIIDDRSLIRALYGRTLNPYPHVRYSERPDLCATHIIQGYCIVLVDNVPSGMIFPTTYFEQIQQVEEYTQTSLIAFLTKLTRLLAVICSIYLIPFWVMITVTKNPTLMDIPIMEIKPFEFGFQLLFTELVIEWIRQSLVHSPSILSSIMGFIVVFILGDLGIELGAYTKEILVMVALCNLGNFLTPSYEISLANKLTRIVLTVLTLFFHVPGFCIGFVLHFIILTNTATIKYPYLYPFIPFSWKEVKRIMGNDT